MGPKGKCPWITDEDGKAIADSQFIIEHLTKKHNLQELELTPQEAAVARGMRAILEDNLVIIHYKLPVVNFTHILRAAFLTISCVCP
jgi:glutathione S-transferase